MRFTNSIDWFEMWEADIKSMLSTMYRNLVADLECGYDPMGASIARQKEEIADYEKRYHAALDNMVFMTEEQTNKWCFFDLKKRGAIE